MVDLPSRHAGVAHRRQQPDGVAGDASSVDVRRRGDPAVCARSRRSGSAPRRGPCRTLRLDVERRTEDTDVVERLRRRDAATSVAARRHAGYITTTG